MRREHLSRSVKLNAHGDGEVVESKSAPSDDDLQLPWFCNFDFPLGQVSSNICTNSSHLTDLNLCRRAAHEAGASYSHDGFLVTQATAKQFFHPKGCFMNFCNQHDSGTVCYFYNDPDDASRYLTSNDDDDPLADDSTWMDDGGSGDFNSHGSRPVNGTPVCSRPKYMNGTKNGQGGCPAGFEVLRDKTLCEASAVCLEYPMGNMSHYVNNQADDTLISSDGDVSQVDYNNFPGGCFTSDSKIYYNAKSTLSGLGSEEVRGTPLCMHYTDFHFDGLSNSP